MSIIMFFSDLKSFSSLRRDGPYNSFAIYFSKLYELAMDTIKKNITQECHAIAAEEVLAQLVSSIQKGLSEEEVQSRAARFGFNELKRIKPVSFFIIFLNQFKSPLIYLLLIASGIAFGMGEKIDALAILTVLLINAIIGSFQEQRAAISMEALKQLTSSVSRVVRGGIEQLIDSKLLVPGDILLLNEGDAVGADARLVNTASLAVLEASLTGESMPVSKHSNPLPLSTSLADRTNMVYGGTHIARGKGTAVVVAIGAETEIGQIAELTQSTQKVSTPLEEKIARFSRHVLVAAFFVFISIIMIGLMRQLSFPTIFGIALSQVVSMVPEGLPVALTVALAIGMQRMAKRGAIMRRLDAVETLGSTTVICTDKTGTLTRNEMTVTELSLPNGRKIYINGSGGPHQGEFIENNVKIDPNQDECLTEIFTAAALCNDSKCSFNEESAAWKSIGDPTEVSLLMMIMKGGINPEEVRGNFKKLDEIPFNSESKMMAVLVEHEGIRTTYVKGAPESVLHLCTSVRNSKNNMPLTDDRISEIKKEEALMAEKALRLLAFAVIGHPSRDLAGGWETLRGHACYLGVCGQFDPPRAEVKNAVQDCLSAGIVPVIITGDHKITGLAIAKALNIAREGADVVDGQELNLLSDEELDARLSHVSVFARVHPAQKLQIVKAWQRNRATVAMTGDGVNDAPALAKSDIGVAMGITGTEVAKQAAKMVITDDNFATIVRAIEEGRIVHKNLKKMLLYLVSTNVTELFVLYAALIFGYPLPLAAVQILWVNLVTDGVSQIPLIMEPSEGDEMKSPPIPRNEPLITKQLLKRMLFMTPAMAASTLFYFIYRLSSDIPFEQVQTGTFTVLAVCQWFNALNCRSETRSAFKGLFKNRSLLFGLLIGNILHMGAVFLPPLNAVLHTTPMPLSEVFIIGSVSSLVLWVEELRKLWIRYRTPKIKNIESVMNDVI